MHAYYTTNRLADGHAHGLSDSSAVNQSTEHLQPNTATILCSDICFTHRCAESIAIRQSVALSIGRSQHGPDIPNGGPNCASLHGTGRHILPDQPDIGTERASHDDAVAVPERGAVAVSQQLLSKRLSVAITNL